MIPAAFPRNYPNSTNKVARGMAKRASIETDGKIDVQAQMIEMLETQIGAQTDMITSLDDPRVAEQEQLYGCVNRYTRKSKVLTGSKSVKGLSLVMCHANGFNKEVHKSPSRARGRH